MNRAFTLALGFSSVALLALGGCDTMGHDDMDESMDMEMDMEMSEDMEMEEGMEEGMDDGMEG